MDKISGGMPRNESAISGVIPFIDSLSEIGRRLSALEREERLHEVTKTQMDVVVRHACKIASIAADFQRPE
jgi:hypothetical protein